MTRWRRLWKRTSACKVNVNDYDHQGVVFGRPDQVKLDIIIKNDLLLICELKPSIDKANMYLFERKARFYEERHQRKANRLIVIPPMIGGGTAGHRDLICDLTEVCGVVRQIRLWRLNSP